MHHSWNNIHWKRMHWVDDELVVVLVAELAAAVVVIQLFDTDVFDDTLLAEVLEKPVAVIAFALVVTVFVHEKIGLVLVLVLVVMVLVLMLVLASVALVALVVVGLEVGLVHLVIDRYHYTWDTTNRASFAHQSSLPVPVVVSAEIVDVSVEVEVLSLDLFVLMETPSGMELNMRMVVVYCTMVTLVYYGKKKLMKVVVVLHYSILVSVLVLVIVLPKQVACVFLAMKEIPELMFQLLLLVMLVSVTWLFPAEKFH